MSFSEDALPSGRVFSEYAYYVNLFADFSRNGNSPMQKWGQAPRKISILPGKRIFARSQSPFLFSGQNHQEFNPGQVVSDADESENYVPLANKGTK
jgi:hypothetical protein